MQIESVADIVRAHSAAGPDAVALSLGERTVSWTELYERARRVASGVGRAGVGPQDRVAFLDKNGVEHFEVVYGGGSRQRRLRRRQLASGCAGARLHRQRRAGQGARRRPRLRAGARRHGR